MLIKYKKIKFGEGDFESFDPGILHEALVAAIGKQREDENSDDKWYMETNNLEIRIVIKDDSIDTSQIDSICKNHFKTDWTNYDPVKEEKDKLKIKIDECTDIDALKALLKEVL